MASRAGTSRAQPFLPEALRLYLRRRALEGLGLLIAALGVLAALALASYAPADPSFNSAGPAGARNLLGLPGAYVADLLLQGPGLGSALLVPLFAAWGWSLLRRRSLTLWWLRLAAAALALIFAALGFAALPAPEAWPLRAGMGGALGLIMAQGLAPLAEGAIGMLGLAAAAFALAGASFVVALGLTGPEWQALGRALRTLFRLLALGLGAALSLIGRSNGRRREEAPGRARTRARREPRLVAGAPPEDHEDEPAPPVREGPPLEIVAKREPRPRPGRRPEAERQATLDLLPETDYQFPPLELLNEPPRNPRSAVSEEALAQNARLLESVLADFGVSGEIVKVRPGPVVTLYELEPAPGTKSSRVVGLSDDIARYMSAVSVRAAVIPGRNVIGIEIPNASRETVHLRELLASEAYEKTAARLTLALGKDIGGAPVIADLSRMPHLLVAGTTGSGKSVAINSMILSLLYRLPPDQCKFIMIDPKMLELSVYDGIPHLLAPVVTEPSKAIVALKWTVKEMESRYQAMAKLGVRNIAGFNKRLAEARERGEELSRTVQTGFDPATGEPVFENQPFDLEPLPFVVVVVDEMADLMMIAGKDVEAAIQRLSQMARAAGIHLIMATQRPSVDVITGTIKANFPTRVSFQVTSKIDSRTILNEQGAEQLLGQGDMLYQEPGGRLTRVHGPFVSDTEIERVVRFLLRQGRPDYLDAVTEEPEEAFAPGLDAAEEDPLYDQALALVCRERKASTSFVQRHLQIGYNRAARIIERMEAEGVVTPANHVGKREVLARDFEDRAS